MGFPNALFSLSNRDSSNINLSVIRKIAVIICASIKASVKINIRLNVKTNNYIVTDKNCVKD